jgi:two-component system alkaline phosphatase synthesis response regulator PhoP
MTKSMPTVLIIEDDADIVELVQYNLQREGFRVHAAIDGEAGLAESRVRRPSLILLDLMLPGIEGLEVCRLLKTDERTRSIPVIMLTAKGEESDVVVGLGVGADDYVTKPFSPRELVARVRAVLRRRPPDGGADGPQRLQLGPLTIDTARHEVLRRGKALTLTRSEFRLLKALATHPGRVFTRDELLDKITGGEAIISDRNVDVHIRSIRKKLQSDADLLVTVRGVGYKCRD